jgi:hypothetical protein
MPEFRLEAIEAYLADPLWEGLELREPYSRTAPSEFHARLWADDVCVSMTYPDPVNQLAQSYSHSWKGSELRCYTPWLDARLTRCVQLTAPEPGPGREG